MEERLKPMKPMKRGRGHLRFGTKKGEKKESGEWRFGDGERGESTTEVRGKS